jgi:flagellar M-ring protein FliF
MDWLRRVLDQAFAAFKDMTAAQRASMVMLALTIIFTLGLVAFLGARPKFSVVASGLDNSEMADAVRYLDEIGEEYKTDPARGAILVNQDRKAVIQKRLLASQVISSEKIFSYAEFIDKTDGIHVSNRHRDELFRIALQNEIKRMIEGLEGVERAKVEIQKERDAEWGVGREKIGTAITLTTKRSVKLDQAMANTIIDLVHSSVRNSDPQKVTVVDTRNWGKKYRREDPNSVVVKGAHRLDLTHAFEQHLLRRVRAFIAETGFEAAVSVSVILDLEHIRETVYKVIPDETVEVSSEKRKLKDIGGTGAGGATGVPASQPGVAAAGSTGGGRTGKPSERSDATQKLRFDYSRILQEVIRAPGKSSDIRLSVVLQDRIVQKKDEKTGRTELIFVSPTDEQKADWRMLLANIVGKDYDSEQAKKKVIITHMKPNRDEVMAMLAADVSLSERLSASWPVARVGGVFLLATFALFFLYGLGKRAATNRPVITATQSKTASVLEEGEGMEPPPPEESEFHDMQKRVRSFAEQDPRRVASLIKRWLVRES